MWQRFTERARKAVFYAQEEAGRWDERFVTTEHLLLGLIKDDDSMAVRVLEAMDINTRLVRLESERHMKKGNDPMCQDMQLTPRAKRVIDMAYDEARQMNSNYIGTEQLLLGVIREGEGPAARILAKFGANLERTRQVIGALQTGGAASAGKLDVSKSALRGRDLLSIRDLSSEDIWEIFRTARMLKSRTLREQVEFPLLAGKTLAMIFEKPSLRTRVTFETGMTQLGGHAIYLQPSDIRLGERETVADAARNLERWVQGIMARTFKHKTVADLAKYANIPVINGLSDLEHPCQALADFFTIYEKKGNLAGLKFAFVGDGCNTCHSLMLLAAKVGANVAVGCPEGYEPDTAILTSARRDAKETSASISIVNDPFEAVQGANVIYTDVWASMGLEDEREKRMPIFQPFQVNQKLVDAAADDVIVMHCLPAHRGEEITDEVMDGPRSVVFDEAENRLHVQKAIMALLM